MQNISITFRELVYSFSFYGDVSSLLQRPWYYCIQYAIHNLQREHIEHLHQRTVHFPSFPVEEAYLLRHHFLLLRSYEGSRLDGTRLLCLTGLGEVRHGLPWESECRPVCIYLSEATVGRMDIILPKWYNHFHLTGTSLLLPLRGLWSWTNQVLEPCGVQGSSVGTLTISHNMNHTKKEN